VNTWTLHCLTTSASHLPSFHLPYTHMPTHSLNFPVIIAICKPLGG